MAGKGRRELGVMLWTLDKTCAKLNTFFFFILSFSLPLLFHKFSGLLFYFIASSILSFFALAFFSTHSSQLLPYILFTGIIDPPVILHSPTITKQSPCVQCSYSAGGYPYSQVLTFLDFFTTDDESARLSTFRFFPFTFFPSDCNSVDVDGSIGVCN